MLREPRLDSLGGDGEQASLARGAGGLVEGAARGEELLVVEELAHGLEGEAEDGPDLDHAGRGGRGLRRPDSGGG
jgi:hypothetical protein